MSTNARSRLHGWLLLAMLASCQVLVLAAASNPAKAQEARPVSKVLITNANVFDDMNEKLATGMSVLVEGNKIKMCGPRDPHPGKLGVVEEGALADLFLVDGNPLENLDLVADPEKNFVVIIKDGVICKNSMK